MNLWLLFLTIHICISVPILVFHFRHLDIIRAENKLQTDWEVGSFVFALFPGLNILSVWITKLDIKSYHDKKWREI